MLFIFIHAVIDDKTFLWLTSILVTKAEAEIGEGLRSAS